MAEHSEVTEPSPAVEVSKAPKAPASGPVEALGDVGDVGNEAHDGASADCFANGVPKQFVAGCQHALAILMTWAQMDFLKSGLTESFFAVARRAADGTVVMDSRVATLEALGWAHCSLAGLDRAAILIPDGLCPDESNQVMIDLASRMEVQDPAFVIRVSNDVWMPAEGLTQEGLNYLRAMSRAEQLKLSGSVQLWTAEFLSPGNVWYAKSSHTVYGGRIAPADFVTAAVSAVVPTPVPRPGP